MKEIKFRAWDGLRMTKSGIQFSATDGTLTMVQNMPLMQYTGLKDKNGKEIYEGDIVRCKFAFGDNICEIVYDEGCFWVSQKNREVQDKAHDNLYWHKEGIEVIGNIYENPELLK